MTPPLFPGLTLDDAELEIHAHIFSRHPDGDHEAKMRRVAMALTLLGDPQEALRVIHVTGTNGKTSTSRMTESLLRASGLRTGLFTSPHLHTLRERIQVNGEPIAQLELLRLWQRVSPVIHRVDVYSLRIGGARMSFFEVLTVLGLVAFADARVQAAVVEVGIGGLRDATNVCDGEVAVLTPMGLDHSGYFGDTVADVAREKSGIIKPHAAVVSALQPDEAAELITEAARSRRASLLWQGAHLSVESRVQTAAGQVVTMRAAAETYPDVFVPLHGEFQAQNALVALAAVEMFVGRGVPRSLPLDAVQRGFAAATSPGRLEQLAADPLLLVDAAHNPHGVGALAAALPGVVGDRRVVAVMAVLGDKDAAGIAQVLAAVADVVVVTKTSSPRAMEPEQLAEVARDAFGDARVTVAETVSDAVTMARLWAGAEGAVLCTGSITLVGEVRGALLGAGRNEEAGEAATTVAA